MKKKFLATFMLLAVFVSAVADNHYIGTVSELEAFRNAVNNGDTYSGDVVYLTADISLNNASWTPIAHINDKDGNGFQGTFDGQGHTISNFNCTVERSGTNKPALAGLFGLNRGSIMNLRVTGATVHAEATAWSSINQAAAGVIVGMNRGSISNCCVYSSAVSSDTNYLAASGSNSFSGGIAGTQYKATGISNCFVADNVTLDATGSSGTQFEDKISNVWRAQTNGSDDSNPRTNCCTSNDTYTASWRKGRVDAAVSYVNNLGGSAAEPYWWDANGITPYITYAFRVEEAQEAIRAAAAYEKVAIVNGVADTYTYNGATYNLYPAGHVLAVTTYPKGVAINGDDAGYELKDNARAVKAAWVDDTSQNDGSRYFRTHTATVTMPSTYPTDATVLNIAHTGLYKVAMVDPANIAKPAEINFLGQTPAQYCGMDFYETAKAFQIKVTVYPLGLCVEGNDAGYELVNVDELGAGKVETDDVIENRYTRSRSYTCNTVSGVNNIEYDVESVGYFKLTVVDAAEGLRNNAVVKTEPTIFTVSNNASIQLPMYKAGSNIEVEYSPLGYHKEWSENTHYYVSQTIIGESGSWSEVSNVITDDLSQITGDNYHRSQVITYTWPADAMNATTLTYHVGNSAPDNATRNDILAEVQALNVATIKYNNWGVGTAPYTPYFIDEDTYINTGVIYYALKSVTNPANVAADAQVVLDDTYKREFEYSGATYDIYPAGTQIAVNFYPQGYNGLWNNHGNYVDEIKLQADGESEDYVITELVNDLNSYSNQRYSRKQSVTMLNTLNAPLELSYTTTTTAPAEAEDMTAKIRALNAATIEYYNWNVGDSPVTPFYIDEDTYYSTNKMYYVFLGITDPDAVAAPAVAVIDDTDKVEYTYNDVPYALYPAGADVTVNFYPQGYRCDWAGHGNYVGAISANGVEAQYTSLINNLSSYSNNHYEREQQVLLPGAINGPLEITYELSDTPVGIEAEDMTDKIAALNKATIEYNNWGVGSEPAVPYYIDPETYQNTGNEYYVLYDIDNSQAELGSVREDAAIIHSADKVDYEYMGTTYALYPAGSTITLDFYLEGYSGNWSNAGYYINELIINDDYVRDMSTSYMNDSGVDEDGNSTFDENTDRFLRRMQYEIAMPAAPTTVGYTTMTVLPTKVEDAYAATTRIYGVNGAIVAEVAQATVLHVVAMDGRVVYSKEIDGNARIALPAGIYVANGCKVVVR